MSRLRRLALAVSLFGMVVNPVFGSVHEHRTDPALRIAQAEESFEATEAPPVTLEEPQNLERSGEPVAGAGPESPPPPPPEGAPIPEWWEKAQQSLDRAIDEQTGETAQAADTANESEPGEGDQPSLWGSLGQGIVSLFVVIALILLCTWAIKRFGARTPLLAGTSLGTVLGKVYLTPKIALHFVKVRNIVLVVGVTPNEVSPIAQLNAALFDDVTQGSTSGHGNNRQMDFLSHLTHETGQSTGAQSTENEDDEITALKGDLARLQKYLQETSRELGD